MGRPTKRTPEREKRLLQALSAGNTRRAACAYAGVAQRSFERWMVSYAAFVDAVEKAEADAEVRNVAIVQQAASRSWQAAAWWLERRRYADFALRTRSEVSGPDGGPISIDVESRESLASRVAELATRIGATSVVPIAE